MTNNQMRQYEIEQAKKRMATYGGNAGATNTGMTNTVGGYTNTVAQNQLKGSEKVKAQEDMNNTNTMY